MQKIEKTFKLEVVEWEEHIWCVYLNNIRIAGGKPWGGGKIVATFSVREKDLENATSS